MNRRPLWRRFVQLRLATLLLLITAFCLVMAFRQAYITPYRRQAEAVKKLAAMQGAVEFEPAKPAWLAPFVGREIYHDVVRVHLEHRGVQDEQLNVLLDLPKVRYLYLAGNPITDEGARNLLPLKHVRRLSLWRTGITDVGLEYLTRNRDLEALDIHATRISDDGLVHLVKMQSLFELKLGPRITDVGMVHIGKLANLSKLDLAATRVTPRGMSELAGCKIETLTFPWQTRELIGDELVYFRDWKYLRKLPDVRDCTDQKLHNLPLRRLWFLKISGRGLTGAGLQFLAKAPALEELQIGGRFTIDDVVKLKSSRVEFIHVTSPLIGLEDIRDLPMWSNPAPQLFIASPWVSPNDVQPWRYSTSQRPGMPQVVSVVQMPRHEPPSRTEEASDVAFPLDVATLIDDWRPLARYRGVEQLELNLPEEAPIDLGPVFQLKDLSTLVIRGGILDPRQLERLAQLENLTFLYIDSPSLDRERLDALATTNRDWKVDVIGNWFSAADVQRMREAAPLAKINFSRPQSQVFNYDEQDSARRNFVSRASLSQFELDRLAEIKSLESLNLFSLSPRLDLNPLTELPNLRRLHLDHPQLRGEQWQSIWNLSQLQQLVMNYSGITDIELMGIERLPNLMDLDLSDSHISDVGLEPIGRIKDLHALTLNRSPNGDTGPWLTDDGLAHLDSLSELQSLSLTGTAIGNDGLKHLVRIPKMSSLDVSFTQIDNGGFQYLMEMPSLTSLNLRATRVDEGCLEMLAAMSGLREVRLLRGKFPLDEINHLKRIRPDLRVHY